MFVEKLKQQDFDEFVKILYCNDIECTRIADVVYRNGTFFLKVKDTTLRENSIFVLNDFNIEPFNYSAIVDANWNRDMKKLWRKFMVKKFGSKYCEKYEKFRKEEIAELKSEMEK